MTLIDPLNSVETTVVLLTSSDYRKSGSKLNLWKESQSGRGMNKRRETQKQHKKGKYLW